MQSCTNIRVDNFVNNVDNFVNKCISGEFDRLDLKETLMNLFQLYKDASIVFFF